MTSWWSLTKKELRLGLPALVLPLIAFMLIAGIAAYIGSRHGFIWEGIVLVSGIFISFHVFYLTYYMLYSLSSERKKLHLWLHNPLPGYSLLLAKLVAALISMTITIFIIGTISLLSIHLSENITQYVPWSDITNISLFAALHLFLIAITIAVWFIFFWMIYLLFTRSLGTFLSFISTFALFLITAFIVGWFQDLSLYDTLTSWGEINLLEMLHNLQFTGPFSSGGMGVSIETSQTTIYLGSYVFEALITIILFLAACWMLDRKVEV